MRGDALDADSRKSLLGNSNLFETEYEELVTNGQLCARSGAEDLEAELHRIVNKSKELSSPASGLPFTLKVRKLMAHIFAYWTLSKLPKSAEVVAGAATGGARTPR